MGFECYEAKSKKKQKCFIQEKHNQNYKHLMLRNIAKSIAKIFGFYNVDDEGLATHIVRFRYDKIPVKFRPFIHYGLKIVLMMVDTPPQEDDEEDEKKD
jgi:hypothetical protein